MPMVGIYLNYINPVSKIGFLKGQEFKMSLEKPIFQTRGPPQEKRELVVTRQKQKLIEKRKIISLDIARASHVPSNIGQRGKGNVAQNNASAQMS